MIYLDNNATTPVRPEVFDAMLPYLKDEFGNPSSIHQLGQRSRKAIEDARAQVAAFLGADSAEEILLTSGGTESNNLAIKGAVNAAAKKGRVVSSPIEHSSVRNVLKYLADTGKIDHVVAPVQPTGIMRVEDMLDAMTPDTILVCMMAANNEIGTFQPVDELAKHCRQRGVLYFSDGVQLAGKVVIQCAKWGVDMLSIAGHKFGAPKGTGALYIRKGTRLHAMFQGGRQEMNRRAGTENVAGHVGLGKACELAQKEIEQTQKQLSRLRDLLEGLLLSGIPLSSVNGDRGRRICNTTNMCFPYTDSTQMIMALDMKGISCSNGSACIAGSPDPSHVLLAMGLPQDKAHASLRFSLGHNTTEEEIRSAAAVIIETVQRLRKTNPLWKEAV